MIFSDHFYVDISRINLAHEFVLDSVHKCEYPHGRGQYGLVYGISGEAEYRFSTGERCTIRRGELLLLSPSTAYSIILKGEFKHYTVNFEIHEETSKVDFFKSSYCLVHMENPEQYRQCLKKMTALWMSKKPGFEMLSMACAYELLAFFCSDLLTKEYATASYLRLLPAKEFIEQNFSSQINLELLAKLCGMSVTNFRREWAKAYKESALQYRDKIRISYAKEYLFSGYYTVFEVAAKCGFEDVSYFVRFFKKHTGSSPGAFKKRSAIL